MFFKNIFSKKNTGKTVNIINCSLSKNGKTELMIKYLTEGIKKTPSSEVSCYNLHEMNIIPCNGCMSCWYKHPNTCNIDDDLSKVIDSIFQSDIIIIASPVWNGSGTHLFKIFIERIFPVFEPFIIKNGEYYCLERTPKYSTTDIYLLSGCGLPGYHNFHPIIEQVKALEYLFGFSLKGLILKDQCMEMDFAGEDALNALYDLYIKAGQEILSDPDNFKKTCESILNPIYKPEEYKTYFNSFFEKLVKKN